MPSRVYSCGNCKKTSTIEWQVGGHPRCKGGSQDLRKVT